MSKDKTNKEFDISIEYQGTLSYLHHMYDTRHRIFQFGILVNAGLLAVVFKAADSPTARVLISVMGFVVVYSLTLMAIRSDQYRIQVEEYAQELETKLGFGLVTVTNQRMPKGLESANYLFYSYRAMVLIWILLTLHFSFEVFGISVFNF